MGEMTIPAFVAELAAISTRIDRENKRALKKAGDLVVDEIREAIGTYRYGWAPLAASTLEKKAADTPLLETGALRASYHATVVDGHTCEVSSNDPKAEWQEDGTPTIPPRPVSVPAAQAKEAEVVELLTAATFKAIG